MQEQSKLQRQQTPGLQGSHIQALDKSSVHRICSGQVILDLTASIKELIENSIDAGATQVTVRLKNYGEDSIQVSDNGSGIDPADYKMVALKHFTSKLR